MADQSERGDGGFTLWVDADATPREVRGLTMRTAERRRLAAAFVANSWMRVPESQFLRFVLVPAGADKADDHIVEKARGNDLVVTDDIPLAARLVEAGVLALNSRGEVIDSGNIGERLAMRNLMTELRSAGVQTGGPKEYGRADLQRFANALDRILTRIAKLGRG
ncbi:MAG: YaiI/YqxD family protein [Planctomycetota bacterium]|jgi:uncharacterized protein YaiI (UPF0178 family)|nr:YaiI/YqxD family protein [Planctomycetota bacterium]